MRRTWWPALGSFLLVALVGREVHGASATIAVAANFAPALEVFAAEYRAETGDELQLVSGSTGKLYAQIRQGAPFDVLLAADQETPRKLFEEGSGRAPFGYAIGALVLWSKKEGYVDGEGRILTEGAFRRLALANPEVAPYGRAARQFLTRANLWTKLSARFVWAENIGQAYQFVDTENAELGFVALSQVLDPARPKSGSYWIVPGGSYEPLVQDGTLLERGANNAVAQRFIARLQSERTCEFIRRYGYRCPRQAR